MIGAERITLSLCMIVRNEERYLKQCLESVQGQVDEIVIVDTGSTDGSMQIAGEFGARIVRHIWTNDFSAARNRALEQAKGDWILHLDADEACIPGAGVTLRDLITTNDADAYTLIVRNFQPGGDLVTYMDDQQVRLFRNKTEYRYQQRVHEQIGPSIIEKKGIIRASDQVIEHYGYMENPEKKAARNLPLMEAEMKARPNDAYLHFKMGETLKALNRFSDAKTHFKRVLELNYRSFPAELLDTLYMRLAQIELASDQYPEVLKYCLEGLKLNSNNSITMYILSIALIYMGQVDRAFTYLLKIRATPASAMIDPSDIDRLYEVCITLNPGLKPV